MSFPILAFQEVRFDVVDRNNQSWLRGPQIADALKMRDRRGIHDLYIRHADEFADTMTAVIMVPTTGGPQQVRIFSLRGCHLLAMLARTERAKEFRRWVLDLIERETTGPAAPPAPAPETVTLPKDRYIDLLTEMNDLLRAKLAYQAIQPRRRALSPQDRAEIARLIDQGLTDKVIAVQTGRSEGTVGTVRRQLRLRRQGVRP